MTANKCHEFKLKHVVCHAQLPLGKKADPVKLGLPQNILNVIWLFSHICKASEVSELILQSITDHR